MENKNIKVNKKRGRTKYYENIEQLKQLFKQVADKKITNEQAWHIAKCKKTKWYQLKKKYGKLEGML